MKTKTLLFLILSFFTTQLFAQQNEYGIHYNPSLTFDQRQYDIPSYNYSTGVFYQYQHLKRFGLGAALEYQSLNLKSMQFIDCFFSPCDDIEVIEYFDFVRIPIWANINLNINSMAKTKFNVIVGYAYSKLLKANEKEETYNLRGLVSDVNHSIFGMEVKIPFQKKYYLTLGSHFDLTNIYDRRYGWIKNCRIVFKLSRFRDGKSGI